jgi:hypothetical protein
VIEAEKVPVLGGEVTELVLVGSGGWMLMALQQEFS